MPASPAQVEAAKGGETATRMSPIEAQMAEKDGQDVPPEGCAAAAERVLRMPGATVTKRGETARRAANDTADYERQTASRLAKLVLVFS